MDVAPNEIVVEEVNEELNYTEEELAARFSQPEEILTLDKEKILQMPCTLGNLIEILKRAQSYILEHVPNLQDGNLIVAIGNTGCGKSTMLTSLIYGTDSLQELRIEDPERKNKKWVIEQKE